MKAWKSLLSAAAAAIAAVLVLSLLPEGKLPQQLQRNNVAVFEMQPVSRIGNDNLVDALVSLPLTEPIRRVDWHNAVLSIDFTVTGDTAVPDGLFRDLKRLIQLAFRQSGNVERLLVRFVAVDAVMENAPDSVQGRLMMAADIRRGDSWLDKESDGLEQADPLSSMLWRQRLRLTFSEIWRNRFGVPPVQTNNV